MLLLTFVIHYAFFPLSSLFLLLLLLLLISIVARLFVIGMIMVMARLITA